MAKGKQAKSEQALIGSRGELIAAFEKLVDVQNRIAAAELVRDEKKNEADDDFEAATKEDKALLEHLNDPALDYVAEHREELLPQGLKSGVIGPVTVEFRFDPDKLLTVDGKQPKDATVVLSLETAIKRARGEAKQALEDCLDYKPKLLKLMLKKLPESLLERIGLRLAQEESVSWKPNAER